MTTVIPQLKNSEEKTKNAKRLRLFVEKIESFFSQCGREFPWRNDTCTPYEVWVSEVMLQQTQASRAVAYYERFLARFPTITELANASWEEMVPYWEGLGYYRRGRNMLHCAKMVLYEYGGEFPREVSELERLPGIGAYTARAVASFAYGMDVVAWDTNFDRVCGRYFFGENIKNENEKRKRGEEKLEQHLRLEESSFANFNSAVMDFGSLVCMKNPKCAQCPLQENCRYASENGVREKTLSKKSSAFPMREARAFVILHENHTRYFSSTRSDFTPFVFASPRTSREDIKQFFITQYGLVVSVRPPKMKIFLDEIPTIIVYAQILSGAHNFLVFDKKSARAIVDSWG